MADLAIGISKKVVDGLVKKVDDAIKEEQELWRTVERDSVFIKDEFEMMKSFLKTADRDRVRNNVVRTWVRQVRDLSYDAEDCMDGVLDLEPKRPWWTLSFLPYTLPTWCRPKSRVGKDLGGAVDKIKLIKARVEEVSHRNLRYNLINTTGSGQVQQAATAMDMDLDMAKVQEGSVRLRCLLDYEACHRRLSMISVWGTGGNLGTISIIRDVFDNPFVCQMHGCRAWVKLMHPFSPQKFLGDLVAQLHTNSGAACGADVWSKIEASSADLATEVQRLVNGRSYLIVLEDLSNMVEWYTIRTYLPHEENRSRVIVSTQHPEIARLCTGGQPQYQQELSQLSADHCVYAFFKEARIPSQQNQGSTDAASSSAAANYCRNVPIFGRDEEVRQLYDRITSEEHPSNHYGRVVTVLGPPNNSVEIDAIVAKACSQSTPSFELFAWICVSIPFDYMSFSHSLLSALRPNNKPPRRKKALGECLDVLQGHRCLVVVCGLLPKDCRTLEVCVLTGRPNRSCFVVVTTEESVATYSWREATSPPVRIEPIRAHGSLSGQQIFFRDKRKYLKTALSSFSGSSSKHILHVASDTALLHLDLSDFFVPSELQDRLLPTAGSMGGPSSQLQGFANYWYNNYCLTGRYEELRQLYDMISSSRGHQKNVATRVLTVWGPPSVGTEKYTLVAKVYSQYVLNDRSPFKLYGWVDVSSNPFSLIGFCQSLLLYMQPQLTYTVAATDPIEECLNLLTHNCCLVVIDGLQSMENFHELASAGFIYRHPNSCIILITGEESVATCWEQTTRYPYAVCNVKPLEAQQQGQPPIPGSMVYDITRIFYMANCRFPKFSSIIGRDDKVVRLSSMISSRGQNGSTRVIVISGPPGVGKTALVEQVYSQLVLKQLFDLYGWVQLSKPFNLKGFSQSLLSVLRPRSPESPDPIQHCSYLVQNHSCLVVIDDLQSMENFWELVNKEFIYGHPNSCIVLITTEKSVTTSMDMVSRLQLTDLFQLEVEPLDRESARKLFRQLYEREGQNGFDGSNYLVVDKCCGLPIVIFAVAKYLSWLSRDQVAQFTAAAKDGKFIHELAINTQTEFVGLKGLLAWVDSDLKACPESLKLLILYMFSFSQEETAVVRRKRLVWRWIAEGYMKNSGICDMVAEAEKRVQELEKLTMMMMQAPPGARDTTWHRGYQLSGFSGEVLMSRAAEDPLFLQLEVSALTEGGQRGLTSRGCTGRHLRIDDKWERNEFVFRSLDVSRLRSLTVSGKFRDFFIKNDSMGVLRVLDLENAQGVQYGHLEEIPKLLPRLRFLSVRGSRGIERLPDSIGDLRLLQTLDIRRTMITTLPNSILKLRNLQCLRAGHTMKNRVEGETYIPERRTSMSSRLRGLALASCPRKHMVTTSCYASQGVTMPRKMSSQLTSLHTLGIVNVNTAGGEAILEELQHLEQLRKLELYGINSYNARGLRHLPYTRLDSLSLGFTKDDATSSNSLDILSNLPDGRRLKLHGHVGILQVLPDGIKVTDLTLEIDDITTEEDNMMKRTGKLSSLRSLLLHFHTGQEGGKLKFDASNGDFPQLEVLEISTSDLYGSRLPPVNVEFAPGEGALRTNLKVLKLVGNVMIIPPDGLHHLLSLKEVWARPSLERAMTKVLEKHPNKPAVVDFKCRHECEEPPTNCLNVETSNNDRPILVDLP